MGFLYFFFFYISMDKKKRSMTEIVDEVYDYIKNNEGEIYASNLREVTSNPKTVLDLIRNIQERPYLYFNEKKKANSDKKFTLLKLSSHDRNPKHRYIQLGEVIDFLERKYQQSSEDTITKADLLLVITRAIVALNKIANREPVEESYFL